VATGFVEWGSVFGGAVLAAALSFVLLTFGTAIGLTATSPWPNSGLSAKVIASLAVFWTIAQQIGAFMAGGYVAGRMRARWSGTAQDEVEFRDGLHGALVWGVGIIIGAALLMATAGAAARTGAEVAGKAATSLTAGARDPMDTVLDTMLRPQVAAQASPPAQTTGQGAAQQGTGSGTRVRAASAPTSDDTRVEISRMLAASLATGSLSEPGRAYLTLLIVQRAGVSQQEAERRINDAIAATREAADSARRTAVLAGFITAAGLILSLGAAWWAAMKGGQHRDNSVPASLGLFRRGPRGPAT
jgi:hypothetical protein